MIVDVYGHAARLPARAERALYRVAHDSLANARYSRCSVVRVALHIRRTRPRGVVVDASIPEGGR